MKYIDLGFPSGTKWAECNLFATFPEDYGTYCDSNQVKQYDITLPTKEDVEELINNTNSTWETINGINGRRFTSTINGNSIFIPASGYLNGGSYVINKQCFMLTSTIVPNKADFFYYFLWFKDVDNSISISECTKYCIMSIRGVEK